MNLDKQSIFKNISSNWSLFKAAWTGGAVVFSTGLNTVTECHLGGKTYNNKLLTQEVFASG